jgi:hypothetical protein
MYVQRRRKSIMEKKKKACAIINRDKLSNKKDPFFFLCLSNAAAKDTGSDGKRLMNVLYCTYISMYILTLGSDRNHLRSEWVRWGGGKDGQALLVGEAQSPAVLTD